MLLLREDQSAWPQRAKKAHYTNQHKFVTSIQRSLWSRSESVEVVFDTLVWCWRAQQPSGIQPLFRTYSGKRTLGDYTSDSRLQHATTMVSGVTTDLLWNMLYGMLRTSWAGTLIHNVTDMPSPPISAKARRKLLLRCIDQ